MKSLLITLSLLTFTSAFAGPEDRAETLLDCNVGAYGIKSLVITQDRASFTELEITFLNGSTEKRTINNRALENLSREELFIAQDGELNITLSKRRMDQNIFDFYLNLKGDGYNDSYMISCSEY